MKPKDYSVQEVFSYASVGLKFEFYSSKKTEFIAEDLSRPFGKTVVVTGDENVMPTWTTAILLKEYNGKRPRYQLKIAPQDYLSIGPGINGVLEWINSNAALDYSTRLQVELSFKNKNLHTLNTISNMDIGKMILKIDEGFLYERFPEMEKSPFSLSIKRIVPFDGFINISAPLYNLQNSFKLPIAEHYSVDFTDQTRGLLRFNYIGGSGYAKNPEIVSETLKYYILSTYQVLNSPGYSPEMRRELNRITENYNKIRRAYYEPEFFLKEYKDIKVSVDLKISDQVIKSYWSKIRDPLMKLVSESGLRNGKFNFNSDIGQYELKDAEILGAKVSGIYLIGCNIRGLVENCTIWKSDFKNSRIKKSILVKSNNVESSLLENTRADRSNTINKSYIVNRGEIINCDVNESIIKDAGLGKNAKLDEECTYIQSREEEIPIPSRGLNIEEIRDYRWIKSMRQSGDLGFANEFKIKY